MSKKLLIDRRFAKLAEKKWGKEFEIIPSPELKNIQKPVSCHPDLSLCRIGNTYVAEKTVYEYYKHYLPTQNVICGETVLGSNYPFDIAYNVLISGTTAFANFKYTDRVVIRELTKRKIKTINVKQGYANCSAVKLQDAIITADKSLAVAAIENEIDALKITPGHVTLLGYEYGFLGGASGFVDGRMLIFGDLCMHKDYEKIKEYAKRKNVLIDDIKSFPLTDVGTIIGIDDE